MNQHAKKALLVAGILALLASACDIASLEGVDSIGDPGAGPPPGAQIESRPTPTSKGDVGDADQVLTLDSIQTPIAPAGPAEPLSDVDPEDMPNPEERSATLDRVNLGGPERPGSDEAVGVGPAPGTESVMGPVNDSNSVEPEGIPGDTENAESIRAQVPIAPMNPEEAVGDVDPEDIPSPEERDAILEEVNRGGPERPGSDEAVGAGPEPGTESVLLPYAIRLIEALRNWWHESFN